ncbi:hypothetical protein [uncultured Desulfuromusa sp.]|uniref:hypothetical protein n=1 Tax=uncultured Desulfuromusa sp. TaxID=219183 RepID=UPI002AA7077F|nr:hypothetical protein [uncultured Desulfuromusa sp.]
MSIPIIALDFCSEPADLYCPVCGRLIFALGEQQNICPHLLFWGDSATHSYAWQQDKYAQEFKQVLFQHYEDACRKGFYGSLEAYISSVRVDKCVLIASELISEKSAFMFSISTSDIGCGGMHHGTIYAIFAYRAEQSKLISICPRS